MLQASLGDQVLDPILARDLLTLIDGTVRDYTHACDDAGDCNWGGEKSAHPHADDPWWAALALAQGRLVQRAGRDDLRPRDFYTSSSALNYQHQLDLVGGPYLVTDPLAATTIAHKGYNQDDPIVAAWVRGGASIAPTTASTGPRFSIGAAIGWAAAAAALGVGAAYLTR